MTTEAVARAIGLDAGTLAFLAAHRVARLATVDRRQRPQVVPVCFAVDDIAIYIPLDEKPKRVAPERLQRARNIARNPEVSLLVDDYAEDWMRLAYVMIHGLARLVAPGEPGHATAVDLLRAKYPQYEGMDLAHRPLIRVDPYSTSTWSWSGTAFADAERPAERNLDLGAVVRGRRTVRVYRPIPVPRALVERVLDAARWAPSPHGMMPWRFAVVTRLETKHRLADAMGEEWERQLALDGDPPDVIAKRKRRSRERILDAPVCIVAMLYTADLDRYPDRERQEAETTMAIQSVGSAIQNLLLAAYQAGLDGGWMCAPLFCPDTVRSALELSPELQPQALITLGYAARDPLRREHLTLDKLIVRYD